MLWRNGEHYPDPTAGAAFQRIAREAAGMSEHILSLSYGKDSLACLGTIEQLGWPLERIVHAEFCPYCMAPMTDEAVQMVMERVEVLHNAD